MHRKCDNALRGVRCERTQRGASLCILLALQDFQNWHQNNIDASAVRSTRSRVPSIAFHAC